MTFVRQTPGTDDELVRWRDLIKISVAGLKAINSNVWENHLVTIQISRQIFLHLIKWRVTTRNRLFNY